MTIRACILLGGFVVALFGCGGSHNPAPSPTPATPIAPAPPATCSFTVEASVATFDAVGGTTSMTVTTSPGCRWTTDVASDSWIQVANAGPFIGSAIVPATVAANRSFSNRAGTVAVKDDRGEVLVRQPVTQRGAGCLYTIEPDSKTFDWLGTSDGSDLGLFVARVHAEPADCRWSATPTVSWILMRNHSETGTGDGFIELAVSMNAFLPNAPASTRTGEVVVAGLSGVNPDARLTLRQTPR
jgi:hypothetical protein